MTPALFAALGSIVLLAPAGTLEVSDTARVYARQRNPDAHAAMDLDNVPSLALELDWPTTTLAVQYAPRLAWLDVLGPTSSPTLLLHTAALGVRWTEPRYTLSLLQTAAYGDQDFAQTGSITGAGGAPATGTIATGASAGAGAGGGAAPPAGATPPPRVSNATGTKLDLLPSAEVVRVAGEATRVRLRYLWSRRWHSDFDAGLVISGGADAAAQRLLPRERDFDLGASIAHALSRRDELGTGTSGTQAETSNGYQHAILRLEERWLHRLATSSRLELGAGAAYLHSDPPGGSPDSTWMPTGRAVLSQLMLSRDAQVRFDWETSFAPDINVLLGTLQARLHTHLRSTLTFSRTSLALNLEAAEAFAREHVDATRVLGAGVYAQRELLDWLDLLAGAQLTWQRSNAPAVLPQTIWLLYTGLAAHAPELRF